MAFSGKITAANHADLLAKVTNFITGDPGTPGRDWTVARQDSLTWGPATVFRNTGLSGSEEVYVGLCAATYTDGVKGGLVCKVYKAFDSAPGGTGFLDTAYGNGTGQNGTHAFLPCWNAAMNVWIWSNKARVVIVAECNGIRQRLSGAAPAFFAAEREPVAFGLPDGRLHEPVAIHDMARRHHEHGLARCGSAQAESGIRTAGLFPLGNDLFLLSRLSPDLQAGRRMDLALRHLPHDQPAGLVERL